MHECVRFIHHTHCSLSLSLSASVRTSMRLWDFVLMPINTPRSTTMSPSSRMHTNSIKLKEKKNEKKNKTIPKEGATLVLVACPLHCVRTLSMNEYEQQSICRWKKCVRCSFIVMTVVYAVRRWVFGTNNVIFRFVQWAACERAFLFVAQLNARAPSYGIQSFVDHSK